MSAAPMWRLFAFMDDDPDGARDETRTLADWQIGDVLRWCQTRGYDHVYFRRATETAEFEHAPAVGEIDHRFLGVRP